jgi:hypothetical protein
MKALTLFSGVAGVALVLLLPTSAFAASQGSNITTSPVSVDLTARPGSSVTTTLQVENNASTPVPMNIQLETFKAYGTNGQAQILKPTAGDTYINWVHFSKTSFVATPGVWVPVQMTITLPNTAALGYYYAVMFRPGVSAIPGANTNVVKASNAILVLLDAQSGNAQPHIAVTSFTADKKLYEYLPATFSVDVRNTGNIYLPPSGDIYISKSSAFNKVIATIGVNSTLGNVLPGSSRDFVQQWSNGFPLFVPKTIDGQRVTNKQGKLLEQLRWNFSQAQTFRFGKYYARLALVYNNGKRDVPIQATLSFWVIPWKLLLIVLVVVAVLGVGLYSTGRKIVKRTHGLVTKAHKR